MILYVRQNPQNKFYKKGTSKILNFLINLGCDFFLLTKKRFQVAEKDIWHGIEDMYVYKNIPYDQRDTETETEPERQRQKQKLGID